MVCFLISHFTFGVRGFDVVAGFVLSFLWSSVGCLSGFVGCVLAALAVWIWFSGLVVFWPLGFFGLCVAWLLCLFWCLRSVWCFFFFGCFLPCLR